MKALNIIRSKSALVLAGVGVAVVALAVSTGGVYAAEAGVISGAVGSSGSGGLGGLIATFGDKIINYLYIIAIIVVIAKNLWDMSQSKEIWGNVKDIVVGIAIMTILIRGALPAILGIGETTGGEIKTTVDGSK